MTINLTDPSNHPANGPLTAERIKRVRDELQRTMFYSSGGVMDYIVADAIKGLDELLVEKEVASKPVGNEELDQMIWKLERDGMTPKMLSLMRELREVRRVPKTPAAIVHHDEKGFHALLCKELPEGTPLYVAPAAPYFREIANSSTKHFWENEETSTNSPCRCWCQTCRPVTMNDMRFVVCPECGNKRCPHANDHNNACTGSNEPGQIGSAYPAAPQGVKWRNANAEVRPLNVKRYTAG